MRNLCKGSHCVRRALEADRWELGADGQLERRIVDGEEAVTKGEP